MRLRPQQIRPDGTDGDLVADGDYAVSVLSGEVVGLVHTTDASRRVLPLTTAINGAPELVWDDNDEIVLTEVPQ